MPNPQQLELFFDGFDRVDYHNKLNSLDLKLSYSTPNDFTLDFVRKVSMMYGVLCETVITAYERNQEKCCDSSTDFKHP